MSPKNDVCELLIRDANDYSRMRDFNSKKKLGLLLVLGVVACTCIFYSLPSSSGAMEATQSLSQHDALATPPSSPTFLKSEFTSTLNTDQFQNMMKMLSGLKSSQHFNPVEVNLMADEINRLVEARTLTQTDISRIFKQMQNLALAHKGHTGAFVPPIAQPQNLMTPTPQVDPVSLGLLDDWFKEQVEAGIEAAEASSSSSDSSAQPASLGLLGKKDKATVQLFPTPRVDPVSLGLLDEWFKEQVDAGIEAAESSSDNSGAAPASLGLLDDWFKEQVEAGIEAAEASSSSDDGSAQPASLGILEDLGDWFNEQLGTGESSSDSSAEPASLGMLEKQDKATVQLFPTPRVDPVSLGLLDEWFKQQVDAGIEAAEAASSSSADNSAQPASLGILEDLGDWFNEQLGTGDSSTEGEQSGESSAEPATLGVSEKLGASAVSTATIDSDLPLSQIMNLIYADQMTDEQLTMALMSIHDARKNLGIEA